MSPDLYSFHLRWGTSRCSAVCHLSFFAKSLSHHINPSSLLAICNQFEPLYPRSSSLPGIPCHSHHPVSYVNQKPLSIAGLSVLPLNIMTFSSHLRIGLSDRFTLRLPNGSLKASPCCATFLKPAHKADGSFEGNRFIIIQRPFSE